MSKANVLIAITLIAVAGITSASEASELTETIRLAPKYGAKTEVRLWDNTRVDMLSDVYAIEVDWAPKHYQAVGQSLWYAEVTHKKPGIILLVKDMVKEARHIYRCQVICARVGIRLWIEKAQDTPPPAGTN